MAAKKDKALLEKEKLRKETMEEALESKDFYDPLPVLNLKGDFSIVYGQRSNGKTYGFLKYALENYKNSGRTFVYVRRWAEDISVKNMTKLFAPLPVTEIFGEGNEIKFARGAFWLHNDTEEEDQCIGWAIALNQVAHTKSQTFTGAQIVILDEFLQLATERKLKDEFDAWEQTLSTILRTTNDARIFILGNSIGKYSEYFTPYGVDPNALKQGEIKEIELPNEVGEPTKVVVQWCPFNPKIGRRTSRYVRGSKMAVTGEWESKPVTNIPHTDNERAKEKMLCSIYDPNMNLTLGVFLRTATWMTFETKNLVSIQVPHMRQFLVIRVTDKKSSFYHLTTVKDLKYTTWTDLLMMFNDIKESTGIDIMDELKMGRVFAEDSFTADYFYHAYLSYMKVSTRDLL